MRCAASTRPTGSSRKKPAAWGAPRILPSPPRRMAVEDAGLDRAVDRRRRRAGRRGRRYDARRARNGGAEHLQVQNIRLPQAQPANADQLAAEHAGALRQPLLPRLRSPARAFDGLRCGYAVGRRSQRDDQERSRRHDHHGRRRSRAARLRHRRFEAMDALATGYNDNPERRQPSLRQEPQRLRLQRRLRRSW